MLLYHYSQRRLESPWVGPINAALKRTRYQACYGHPRCNLNLVRLFRFSLLILFLSSHSSKVSSGDGLVGGNPTMNTPRLRRRGDSFLFIYFIFYLYWYSYIIVYSVCDSASEFEAMGSTSFLGFSYPNLLLVFLNLLFLGTCIIFFSQVLDFLWFFICIFIVIFLYLILG